jgi:cell division septum initiation protein DivIVA
MRDSGARVTHTFPRESLGTGDTGSTNGGRMSSNEDVSVAPSATEPAPGESPTVGAARLLEVAARNAEQLVGEAQAEAVRLKAEAEAEAEKIVGAARGEADRIRAESEESRSQANREIAGLRETERQHRERMQSHLQEMLAKVEANSVG